MKRILYALAAAVALYGCAKEADLLPDTLGQQTVTLTASVQPESRVAFANDQQFQWQAGDVIGVYAGSAFVPFTLSSGAGSATGTFTGSVSSGTQIGGVALYPNNAGSTYSNGVLSFQLPRNYENVADFSAVRMPMAAQVATGASSFSFYNVGGVVKLTLTKVPAEAKYFKLTADQPITGTYTVNVSGLGSGATLTGEGTGNEVEIQLASGKAADKVEVYLPVPPGTYKLGVGIYGDGVTFLEKTGTKANTISRGTILRMPALEIPEPILGDSDWSLIGDLAACNNWGTDIGMNQDGDWSVVKNVSITSSNQFKFRKDHAWTVNFGGTGSNPQTVSLDTRIDLAQDGSNLKVPSTGSYDLWLNPVTACCYVLPAGTTFTHKDSENPTPTPYDPDLDPSKKLSGLTYQLNVYSFAGYNGSSTGKFMGIVNHLDYLDKLGVTAIWLSPIQTAQSYHGYDVKDYEAINTNYGVENAFKRLIQECHKRNIRVYMDYVINHTGDEHKWFMDVRANGPSSQYWNYYSISSNPQADVNAGNIAQIPQGWYNAGEWVKPSYTIGGSNNYYYHSAFGTGVFVDLNYNHGSDCENSPAFKAIVASIDKWLAMGVDGLRLDAVKHIYTINDSNEGLLGDNIQFWQKFYNAVNAKYKNYASAREDLTGKQDEDIFMVGEVLSGEFQCTPFYEGLPAIFEFDFWWQLRDALKNQNSNYFVDHMIERYNNHKARRSSAISTPKLSNHDEDRTATILYDMAKIKQAGAILLTAPGRPFIYQGEELGYWGTKEGGDEYVRAPILWTSDISSAAIGGVNNKYDASMLTEERSVAYQEQHDDSILMMYRHFGYARNTNPALADGWPEAHATNSGTIMSWYLHANDGSGKVCLVMHNIAQYAQDVACPSYDNLSTMLVSNGSVSVNGQTVHMGANSSVVFALN